MHARLTIFLNTNSIPFEKHFGFRHSHSTRHALIKITEKFKQDCDSVHYACEVFLDLQEMLTYI